MMDVMGRLQFDPARLHGHVKMELFDAKTKQLVQKVEKDNLVTNALKYMLNDVAGGKPGDLGNVVMPVATRGLGSLMLFSDTLDSNANNIFFPFAPNQHGNYAYLTGHAGRGTNSTNTRAGSLNATESGPTNSGYVSVWDFGTSQANGIIKAAALTQCSAAVGDAAIGSAVYGYMAHSGRHTNGGTNLSMQPLYYDTDTQTLYFTCTNTNMGYSRTGSNPYTYTMSIYSMYLPMQEYKVGDGIDAYQLPRFVRSISWQDNVYYTPEFFPGYDGYAYFARAEDNASGNGSFKYLALHTDDKSFSLSSWTSVSITEGYLLGGVTVYITGDNFWCISNNKQGIYRINRTNQADVQLFAFPEGFSTTGRGSVCRGGGINCVLYCDAANGQTGYYDQYDALIYPDGNIVLDGNYFVRDSSLYNSGSRPGVQVNYESPRLWAWGARSAYSGVASSNNGIPYSRYLGTIANLSTAIEKNASQTLKVTYTLTDE